MGKFTPINGNNILVGGRLEEKKFTE